VTLKLNILPAARIDITEAFDWYELRGMALGQAFVNETDRQLGESATSRSASPSLRATYGVHASADSLTACFSAL
jgi:hypothetical protein